VKHDKEWLDKNSPARLGSSGTRPRIDWSERDKNFSEAVRETAGKIINAPGRPVWASRTGIASDLRILAVVNKHSSKLPLTNKALGEVSESIESFAARRVRWAADRCRQEKVKADKWILLKRGAVSYKIADKAEVKTVIEECVQMLGEMNARGWASSSGAI
jgi:hypothetical protein